MIIDSTKNSFLVACKLALSNKIEQLNSLMVELKNSIENETKSSVGDKHETGRAMVQLEQEKLSKQLHEFFQMKEFLNQINPNVNNESIGIGNLVETNIGVFFISVGLGKISMIDDTFFAISPISPLGKMLLSKKRGDVFSINQQEIQVISIK